MPKARLLRTNFTAGELSQRLEGRPDLAKYFNGAATLENYLVYPQGGVYRAPGSRFVKEVKDSTKKTRLIPFIVNRTTAYVCEFGHQYVRFYTNGARIESPPGTPVEIASPFNEADLSQIQFVQSVDVLFLDHPLYQTRKLSRVSDTSWALTTMPLRPPPSFEDLTDLGTTLTFASGAVGTRTFTAGGNVFLDGDVDREIVSGASRAVITALNAASPANSVTVDVLVAFTGSPIAAGSWFLDKSPTNFIDPNKKSPVDAKVTVNFRDTTTGAGAADGARAADAPPVIVPGKFIKLYGGLIEINEFINAQQVKGIIRTILSKATAKD
ncbi:MAG TPA: hypothetical protein VGH16_16370, partial [Candidatus Binatia bacterium]